MIGIVDYGMGNLRSVQKALHRVGADAEVVRDAEGIEASQKLVLPGVGAFGDAMENLRSRGFVEPIRRFVDSGRWFLGVCLGLQLLFEHSTEEGEHEGLGILPGRCDRFRLTDTTLKVPHMGWNTLSWPDNGADGRAPLLRGLQPGSAVYFVHSYYAEPTDPAIVAATADYGGPFCSVVHRGNVLATQFHPEKSQRVGLRILANFAGL